MRQTETDLEQAYETMLDAWVRTLMLRDSETEEHTRRVCELTIKMARSIGYPEEELTNLRRGSLLHDIGKIGIPDAILHKPGSLTEDEWKIMRKHPVYAYHLISPIPFPQSTIDIPYCHHEKWDGSGYPRGLRGEEIPLSARVFAVADVWDALTSYRPYRAAWTEEKAIEYIIEQSGQSFDPQVVNVFLHCQMDIDYDTLSTVCVLKTQSLPLLFQFPITVQSKTNGFS
jgi:putative nucleotidyltransferase with HDIG domain